MEFRGEGQVGVEDVVTTLARAVVPLAKDNQVSWELGKGRSYEAGILSAPGLGTWP